MQANQAWLNKDKTITQEQKDANTSRNKTRTSFFPQLSQMRSKRKIHDRFDHSQDPYDDQKNQKQASKYFVINKDDTLYQELFKKMCQEKKDSNVNRARLTKGKLKAYLSKKYKGKVAEKILQPMDLSVPLEFGQYCEMLEKFMN